MKTIELSTYLDVSPDAVKEQVMRPALLNYVVAGLMRFRPVAPNEFPLIWSPGTYKVRMLAFHVLPVGWQRVGIELPRANDEWFVRDRGGGSIAGVWDHLIFITPEGNGTRYTDRVTIDAGLLTPLVVLYAVAFYRHRQRRWRKLVRLGFQPIIDDGDDPW